MYEHPYYGSELVDSLLKNGFIDYEPLVVREKKGRFVVVEGNRRLSAIREIRANPEKYVGRKSDLEEIPVLIFPDNPGAQQENEMRVYLGVRHLFGFREWPPISKAEFLERESKKPGGLDQVIEETQIGRQTARRFLIPYRLLKVHGEDLPEGEDFWVLAEALQRAGIKSFVRLEVENATMRIVSYDKKRFSHLLDDLYGKKEKNAIRSPGEKKIKETRDLSRLANVLGSDEASTVLHNGKSLEEAEIHVDTREQSLKRLSKLSKELRVLVAKVLHGGKSPHALRLATSQKDFEEAVKSYVSAEQPK